MRSKRSTAIVGKLRPLQQNDKRGPGKGKYANNMVDDERSSPKNALTHFE